MTSVWTDAERDVAYTRLCETVSAVGRESETLFLARLILLLAEDVSDAEIFSRTLAAASDFSRK
jgi:uncharacterized protein DUF2783